MTPPDLSNRLIRRRFGLLRRPLYALLILLLFSGLVTVALQVMENKGAIQTERPDDRVTYVADTLVKKTQLHGKEVWLITDAGMVLTALPAAKAPNTFRILLAGESFIMGTPYVHQEQLVPGYGDIANWLRADLEMRLPAAHVEVLNAGIGGQNSSRIRQVVEQLLVVQPDLIVVAMGNNEGFVPATRYNEILHKWILYRALKKALLPAPEPGERPYFSPQDKNTLRIERNFQQNLRAIVALAQAAKIPLCLATLPINYKFVGFDPSRTQAAYTEGDQALQDGRRLLQEGRYQEAIERLAESRDQAWAARFIAEGLEKQGDYEQAREFYRIFVQLLPLNRTRPSYNDFVRRIGREKGLLLVDLEQEVEQASPHGITDKALFVDYCHLTWQGYYRMAAALARAMIAGNLLSAFGLPQPEPGPEEIIARYHWEALYTTDIKIQGRFPFAPH